LLKSRGIRRLVFATHDEHLVSGFRDLIRPCGIEAVSLTELGLPEPSQHHNSQYARRRDGLLLSATSKATVIATMTDMPAIGHARGFYIDPMLRWGGGGPQWFWPIPWPHPIEDLGMEFDEADNTLNEGGYCGPDDRGAYFRSVLCLAWPDAEIEVYEGCIEGQVQTWDISSKGKGTLVGDPEQYFIPDGETAPLARLRPKGLRPDQERAFARFRRAISK
jgi:XTP/dITP diphosphohydrolase